MAGLRCGGIRAILAGAALICAAAGVSAGSANGPPDAQLGACNAPYVQGTVTVRIPETLDITVGFVGKGADGTEYSNLTGTVLRRGVSDPITVTSLTFAPQLVTLSASSKEGVRFRHVKLTPGDYLFYVRRGGTRTPMAAWKETTVKTGDQLTLDLKIDETKMGSLVVTLPEEEVHDEEESRDLSLIPIPMTFTCSDLYEAAYFAAAKVTKGQRTVVVKQVPAGTYRACRGKSTAVVEVAAGKETAVTLVRHASTEQ